MAVKIIVAIVASALVLALGTKLSKNPQNSYEEWKRRNSPTAAARRAKAEGKSNVVIPGKHIDYPGANMGLDEALQNYSVVIAEPVEATSYISDASDEIMTAYKFRIVETLSQRNAVFCNSCPAIKDIAGRFQPTLHNEFLLELSGGTASVEGVEVTMNYGEIGKFEPGKKYLMFLSFTSGGIARTAAGASGVFQIADDLLEPLANGENRISTEIATRFAKKLANFKQAFKR